MLIAGVLAVPPPSRNRAGDVSVLVLARDGSILRGFLSRDDKWRLPARPQDVDPLYRRMLIAAEDARFAQHPGVDPLAALRAVAQFAWHRRIVSGASTLTMQAVRLLEPHRRSLAMKIVEMAKALALERRLSKDRILGFYLTLAPFGGNLEGVRAASLAYFGKEPGHLSPGEAALLVAIPRAPERLRPDRHPAAARVARDRVLVRLARRGVITAAQLAEGRAEAVPDRRRPMPFHAPHLARMLRDASPAMAVQRTTIDPLAQARVEALLQRELPGLDPQASLAAIVVDNRDRRVRAYVGNADFRDPVRRGTIDMAQAVRSPGSALKPFLYALAFDRLLIHPATMLDDRPRHFGDYAPADFDGRFQGEVSAREALQYSLNVPAVAVMERLGPSRFTAALAAAGVALRLPPGDTEPGLAIALGGAGITLADLVKLYAGLANGGVVQPLRYRHADRAGAGTALFGPTAAWYVTDILRGAPPPPGVLPGAVRPGGGLAFKTGTSYGYRDAWAVGYDAAVTIGVWVGRGDGTPMPGRSGRLTAAPVLFRIADLLAPATQAAPARPAGALLVGRRELPPRLRRLDSPGPRGPRILYPPDGAVVEWHGGVVPLDAAGGRRPLQWLVDGRPVRPPAEWRPHGIGFATLSVIDADGRGARSTVRLVP